ncbi:MAG: hypothetical protein GF308_17950 [Candidatus Heimdallarchaeota archaeon]|nr:hypothetical protein [Candidatus Heimdallarchaeota archaeon]
MAHKKIISFEKFIPSKLLSFLRKGYQLVKRIWGIPEIQVIFVLIISRLVILITTQWPMDFDYYLSIARSIIDDQAKLYSDIGSNHMPLVDLLYVLMYFVCPWKNNIIALRIFMKLPFLLSDIGIAYFVMKIIENDSIKSQQTRDNVEELSVKQRKLIAGYLVALSLPLILQTAGGRYDSLLIFCMVMVVYCLQTANWFGVAFFASLGTAAKYIGIICLPFVVFWMKKTDIKGFVLGLLLGLTPIYPFLLTETEAFLSIFLLRASHIAYGFSVWYAIYLLWNGFEPKEVTTIEDTYASSNEPWFISNLYFPFFVLLYLLCFIWYINCYWKKMRFERIEDQDLEIVINLTFISFFIFALTFKAINIQILAWFTPYIALKKKKGLYLEFSLLTVLHGLLIILISIHAYSGFTDLAETTAAQGTLFYYLVIIPVDWLAHTIPRIAWTFLLFCTIIWYQIRSYVELIRISSETFKKIDYFNFLQLVTRYHDLI